MDRVLAEESNRQGRYMLEGAKVSTTCLAACSKGFDEGRYIDIVPALTFVLGY